MAKIIFNSKERKYQEVEEKMYNEELHNLYISLNKFSATKPEDNRLQGRQRQDNVD
jgi:hypothetical protein